MPCFRRRLRVELRAGRRDRWCVAAVVRASAIEAQVVSSQVVESCLTLLIFLAFTGCVQPAPRIFGKTHGSPAHPAQVSDARNRDPASELHADGGGGSSAPAPSSDGHLASEGPSAIDCGTVVAPRELSPYVHEGAKLYALPSALIWGVIDVSSGFDTQHATNQSFGLAGLSPDLLESNGVTDPFDPRQSALAASRQLRILANLWKGDLVLTVASYFSSETEVARHMGVPPAAAASVHRVLDKYFAHKQCNLEPPEDKSAVDVRPEPERIPARPHALFKRLKRSVFRVASLAGAGSAVAITSQLLLTNAHVVAGNMFVRLQQDAVVIRARVVQRDDTHDCAVLLVASSDEVEPVTGTRRHASVEVGETVFTLGYPLGLLTFAPGMVSSVDAAPGDYVKTIQTNAPISPGSSGGGLFDDEGRLLGLTTYTFTHGQSLNRAISVEECVKPNAAP
jgi:S1-C subfamily serine protease